MGGAVAGACGGLADNKERAGWEEGEVGKGREGGRRKKKTGRQEYGERE